MIIPDDIDDLADEIFSLRKKILTVSCKKHTASAIYSALSSSFVFSAREFGIPLHKMIDTIERTYEISQEYEL